MTFVLLDHNIIEKVKKKYDLGINALIITNQL